MHDIQYGVHADGVKFGSDRFASPTVKLGDGKTLIASVGFKNSTGIVFTESDGDPFDKWENGEKAYLVNECPEKEKIYIVFTDPRSIDATIAQLLVAKDMLLDLKQAKGGE
jgi:hypothetical protein